MNRILLVGLLMGLVAVAVLFRDRDVCKINNADYSAALAMSKAEDKYLFLEFTGSDWCDWCIKFNREVSSSSVFQDYVEKNLIVLVVDFSQELNANDETSQQKEKLARCFNVRGFPTMFIISPEGNIIAKTGYQAGGAEAYVEHIKKLIGDSK